LSLSRAAPHCILTLVNAKGYRLSVGQIEKYNLRNLIPFDRDVLLIPDAEVERLDQKDILVLKPFFGIVWNSCGYKRGQNFDEIIIGAGETE
jgi:hypothetical protein